MAQLRHQTTNEIVLSNLQIPKTFYKKAKGLIGTKEMDENFGLWLKPCSSIHTFFMSIAIDVIYLDRALKIQRIDHQIQPWRVPRPAFGSHSVIEIKAGAAKKNNLSIGDQLHVGS